MGRTTDLRWAAVGTGRTKMALSRFALTCCLGLMATLGFSTQVAFAQDSQDATRAAARKMGYEGVTAYQRDDYAVAVDKLGRAFDVVKVPTLGLWYARALVKTGRLVQAAERYAEVTRLEVTEGKVKEQRGAQQEATKELETLQPRIPAVTIAVQGPDCSSGLQILLDENSLPVRLLGNPMPVNPGQHRAKAICGGEVAEKEFSISEAEQKSVQLKLKLNASASGATQAQPSNSKPSSSPVPTQSAPTSSGAGYRTAGWISLGVGVAGVAVGAVASALVFSKKSQFESNPECTGTQCYRMQSEVDSYNRMRIVSTSGLVLGAVGVGLGTTLLLIAPKKSEQQLTAWVGIGQVGFGGKF